MEKQTYNGWTNYATWRVNLEMIDGMEPDDFGFSRKEEFTLTEVFELADALQNHAEEFIELECGRGLARDYALAFLSDVNWREIAQHMVNEFTEV
jgi:hypothetical protein